MVRSATLLDAASYRVIVLSLIPLSLQIFRRSPMDISRALSCLVSLSGFCNSFTGATINVLKVSTAPDLDAPPFGVNGVGAVLDDSGFILHSTS